MFKMFEEYEELLIKGFALIGSKAFQDAMELNETNFLSLCCMMLEEYAKKHNLDVTELAETMHVTVSDINKMYGKY